MYVVNDQKICGSIICCVKLCFCILLFLFLLFVVVLWNWIIRRSDGTSRNCQIDSVIMWSEFNHNYNLMSIELNRGARGGVVEGELPLTCHKPRGTCACFGLWHVLLYTVLFVSIHNKCMSIKNLIQRPASVCLNSRLTLNLRYLAGDSDRAWSPC